MKFLLSILFLSVAATTLSLAELSNDEIEALALQRLAEKAEGIESKGFVVIGNQEYFVETATLMTAIEGTTFCNSLGMKFVSLETVEKNTEIRDYLKTVGAICYWTSGQRVFDNVFQWSGTGQLLTYFNWATGRPINTQVGEICICVVGTTGWWDVPCSGTRGTVCET